MPSEPAASHQMIDDLRDLGDVKVWSLLVTCFGDAITGPDTAMAGPDLTQVMRPLGVRSEAMRVALHRLRKDGWMTSEKSGRISLYRLTEQARAETLAVQDHVYARAFRPPERLHVVTSPRGVQSDALAIAPNTWLSDTRPTEADMLISHTRPDALPDWVFTRLCPADLTARFAQLQTVLDRYARDAIPGNVSPGLRVMILHCWRRLVLRLPPLAASLMRSEDAASTCRRAVTDWLERLPRSPQPSA